MADKKKIIYADALQNEIVDDVTIKGSAYVAVLRHISAAPAVDAVEVAQIKAYLQKKLDEWNALGDRKYEPANMWGYNFIMACFDDLERRNKDG